VENQNERLPWEHPWEAFVYCTGLKRGNFIKVKEPMNDFITTYFKEADVDTTRTYTVESENGTVNYIQASNVIQMIKQTRGQERKEIENIIRKIDFKNGDIHHFLKHLASAMAMDM
jgi:hypothetical protein